MSFDKLAPGTSPDEVGSENEPRTCEYTGEEVYETDPDARFIGERIFKSEDARRAFVEEEWHKAIQEDRQLPEDVEEFIKEEMI